MRMNDVVSDVCQMICAESPAPPPLSVAVEPTTLTPSAVSM